MYKDAVCARQDGGVGQSSLGATALFQQPCVMQTGCCKSKTVAVISKITTRKQLKNYIKHEEENENSALQKIRKQIGSSEVMTKTRKANS